MFYGYVRVSTEEQNLENQKKAILETFNIDNWIEEKKSGTVDFHKRCLGECLDKMQEGDVLVITELSRLGRSITMIFDIISEMKKRKIRCVAIKKNFDLNPENSSDIITSVIMFAFGLSAQIERELISERTKQGLAVARAKGKRVGRKQGEKIYNVKLRKYEKEIITAYKNGESINSIAKTYNVNWSTVRNFIKIYSRMKKPKPLTKAPKKHGHPSQREIEYFATHN
ncbi:recombinase family protein [Methanobrevibacter sp.]|uniref:recombinase family protein n=1 Tax=Methanobrevibacter sp. TaxID=66852 RepID=UPI00388D75D2